MATAAPPSRIGTYDLIRYMTSALLRYPRSSRRRSEVDKTIAEIFSPAPDPNGLMPVSGLALRDGSQIVVFFSEQYYGINRRNFDRFFGTEEYIVTSRYTGPFIPCATSGGDSFGFGAASGDTGTLGCVLTDIAGNRFLLSCNHVIGNLNAGVRGVDEVWSPGAADGGNSSDRVGVLDDFEPIVFGGTHPNYMDAAIAAPDRAVVISGVVGGGIGIVGGVDPSPSYNLAVKKFGKTTGLTVADLVFVGMSFVIRYSAGDALFVNQFGIVEGSGAQFADGGDSGALVVNGGNDAVGLLFAVASVGDVAVASPIGPILNRFGLHF